MASWKDLFDADPVAAWSAKDQKSEADTRRAKLLKSIAANVQAAEKGEALTRGFGKLNKTGSVYQITPKVGRTPIAIDGKPFLTTPAERVSDALKALHAATEAGEFDADIARSFGDEQPVKRRRRRKAAAE